MIELPPIVAYEVTSQGWRGLTARGELLEVSASNGVPMVPDGELIVQRGSQVIGRRRVIQEGFSLSEYLARTRRAVELYRQNRCGEALNEIEAALAIRDTAQSRLNRSIFLLSLGRWPEGFAEHEARFEMMTPPRVARAAERLPRWRGDDLRGRRLMLVHDAGHGDSIMCARYIPELRRRGALVVLNVPAALERLLSQLAPVVDEDAEADMFCPLYSLPHALSQTLDTVPSDQYLSAAPNLVGKWREYLGQGEKLTGIAWRVGANVEGDYPREIPLADLVARIEGRAVSLQVQDGEVARDLGVIVPDIEDFADVAALASLMDDIVVIDTAALHVAGAIGHPRITCLLSHWASWRFLGNKFYPSVRLCRQSSPGDWAGALDQL